MHTKSFVLVHADGGACHGMPLNSNDRCIGCGIVPDTQSREFWKKDMINLPKEYTPSIAKKDLIHGEYYYGRCRNAVIARWHAPAQCFIHWREKWGSWFTETIKHPVDEYTFDVFVVERHVSLEEINELIGDGELYKEISFRPEDLPLNLQEKPKCRN